MAQEKRLVFDVSDVRILMRCPDCKIELSFRPQSNERVPMGCPNCQSTWNAGDRAIERAWGTVRQLRNALYVVSQGQDGADMFDIQMEIPLSE